MGFWSRLADTFRRKDAAVGTELYGATDGWGISAAGVPVNAFTALQHVAVMACVAILSEDVAKLPIRLYRRLPNGGKEEVKDHYLAPLLRKPNSWQNRFEFVEMMQYALVLRGNASACIIRDERGRPTQLIPVHPDRRAAKAPRTNSAAGAVVASGRRFAQRLPCQTSGFHRESSRR